MLETRAIPAAAAQAGGKDRNESAAAMLHRLNNDWQKEDGRGQTRRQQNPSLQLVHRRPRGRILDQKLNESCLWYRVRVLTLRLILLQRFLHVVT
eukprot:COSAG02_NODE_6837_length_3336_cov_2.065802_5_plen_95_part_00